jgi:hypothetical protein
MSSTTPKTLNWLYVIIFIVTLVALIFVFRQPIYNQLYAWSLIPIPEPYTELYFTDGVAQTIPATPMTVTFTIHNVEYQATEYSYVLEKISSDESASTKLVEDYVDLKHDQSATISSPPTEISPDNTSKIRVTITFTEKNKATPTSQSIYYQVNPESTANAE